MSAVLAGRTGSLPAAAAPLLTPARAPETDAFWEGCGRGELLVQACRSCGATRFPPRPMCPVCRSTRRGWDPVSGRGRIWSFVVAHPPLLPAYAELAPYTVVVVELDDDPTIRLVGLLVTPGPDGTLRPEERPAEIGAPVAVTFEQRGDLAIPAWVLADEAPPATDPDRSERSAHR